MKALASVLDFAQITVGFLLALSDRQQPTQAGNITPSQMFCKRDIIIAVLMNT